MRERFAAQTGIPGLDVAALQSATVVVSGSAAAPLRLELAAAAQVLAGVGHVIVFEDRMHAAVPGTSILGALTPGRPWIDALRSLDSSTEVEFLEAPRPDLPIDWIVSSQSTLFLDVSNESRSASVALARAARQRTFGIAVWSNRRGPRVTVRAPLEIPEPVGRPRPTLAQVESPLAFIVAGLAVECVLRGLLPSYHDLGDILPPLEFPMPGRIVANGPSPRFLVVGAGASGSALVAALAMRHPRARFTICDGDVLAERNLNRWLLGGALGSPKAELLRERFDPWFREASFEAIVRRVDAPFLETLLEGARENSFDAAALCVDDDRSRLELSAVLARAGIPQVHVGSSTGGCEALLSVPGRTACPACAVDLEGRATRDESSNPCIAEAALLGPNLMAAGLAALLLEGVRRSHRSRLHGLARIDTDLWLSADVFPRFPPCKHST